jgi:AraC-like DNA-binding protein
MLYRITAPRAPTMPRKYLNFTTPIGINLAAAGRTGVGGFLIHELGFRDDLTGWNHHGVDSPFWRLYHNPRPGCSLRHDGRRIALDADHLVLIPADTVFDCVQECPRATHLWVHFSVTRAARPTFAGPQIIALNPLTRPVLGEILRLASTQDAARDLPRVHHLVASLLHLAFAHVPSPATPPLPEKLSELLALVENSPHGDLSNRFLAARAGMSVERFIRWFKEHLGQTPAAFVATARINLAREALALSDKSIEQIAEQFGFGNRHYFSRVFAHHVGCGPAEFRLRQRRKHGR